ncbi:hypothetical protein [Lysinibacillus sp. F5]|uniref:hypothetical protein n=1 Tax=Lysinibacillus sp. F5 TaxID=1700846 RepID=UPI000B158509|nr:hypothetical protein [Lysinibacillus sp. F5]
MFTKESQIVKDYVLLIKLGEKTVEDVPDFHNLRAYAIEVLTEVEEENYVQSW